MIRHFIQKIKTELRYRFLRFCFDKVKALYNDIPESQRKQILHTIRDSIPSNQMHRMITDAAEFLGDRMTVADVKFMEELRGEPGKDRLVN